MHVDGKSFLMGAGAVLLFNMCSSNRAQQVFNTMANATHDAAARTLSATGTQAKEEKAAKRSDSAPSASASAAPAPSAKK